MTITITVYDTNYLRVNLNKAICIHCGFQLGTEPIVEKPSFLHYLEKAFMPCNSPNKCSNKRDTRIFHKYNDSQKYWINAR